MICWCSGNKQPRSTREAAAAVPALPSQPSHAIGLVQNQGTPVHTTPTNTQCPWLPTSPPFPSHVVSVADSAAPRWIQGFKLLHGGRRTVCVKLCIHSMDACFRPTCRHLHLHFFPGGWENLTRVRTSSPKLKKKGERKNISQGLGIREITEMEIPSSLWAKQNPGKFGPKNDRRMKPSYMSASVWPVGGEPCVVSVFCI